MPYLLLPFLIFEMVWTFFGRIVVVAVVVAAVVAAVVVALL